MNTAKFNALMESKDFVISMLSQETPEDVQKLFAENGIEITMDEVTKLGKALEKAANVNGDELNEEALEGVSGGVDPATAWLVAKCVIAVGGAGLAVYKWYKSR